MKFMSNEQGKCPLCNSMNLSYGTMKIDVESDFMKCKECKCENKENAKYCVNCGKELKAKKGKKEESL